jgi:hypothetical protein
MRKTENEFANEKYLQEGKRTITSWAKDGHIYLGIKTFEDAPDWVTKETKEKLICHYNKLKG